MTAPTENERRVPPYVALVRIGAVIGMSVMLAFGIFFFVGSSDRFWIMAGFVCIALALPFFVVMRLVERIAEPAEPPPDEPSDQPPAG